jgi:splicing factor 3A subunit 1
MQGQSHGMMMMQRMAGMQQQHGQGFQSFNPGPPGTMGHRPPLLTPAPPVLPPMQHLSQQPPPPIKQMNIPPPAAPVKPPPPVEEEPAAKKAKTLEDSLIPEAVFFATTNSPVMFNVIIPSIPEKPELNCSGQIINVKMALSEQISLIKTKIHELIGLPPGKQKLNMEGLFYKDNKSLAFYNIGDGATIQMSLKERGGRKK